MNGCLRIYRLSHFFANHKMKISTKICQGLNRLIFGNGISPKCVISKNCRMPHGGLGVIIHDEAKIMENVIIHCGVKIVGTPGKSGAATVHSNVILGTNCVLIGPIIIGENSIVGAGAIVTKNVPPNCIVGGNPAHIIRFMEK